MVKKVVALETCVSNKITEGKVYKTLRETPQFYHIIDDSGDKNGVFKSRFKPLEEEMKIKVGSEWVWIHDQKSKSVAKVIFVSNRSIVISINDEVEQIWGHKGFRLSFKPKPTRRTVWLNVYKYGTYSYETKEIADSYSSDGLLFQQEVELIDPREGGEK